MKRNRQEAILRVISQYEVETQQELAQRLKEEGFEVTQATVSRDIRDMKLSKMPTGEGHQKYVRFHNDEKHLSGKYVNVLKEGFVSIDMAQNILVVKTVSGMAMAVAAAIDAMKYPEIVGSIAGDDTIMMAVRTVEDTKSLMNQILQLVH
ncbi:MAG: arginine repressor [Lachnospiraceae bacterium]|jgi:arginine repressor|nr:arginine repressor [Lachnospiraceae bacterium]HCI19091.1 arginine repressor [Lachnospiraceae bacterium]HCX41651.1 arginine repressor [Lachnospiraceae bacterium]